MVLNPIQRFWGCSVIMKRVVRLPILLQSGHSCPGSSFSSKMLRIESVSVGDEIVDGSVTHKPVLWFIGHGPWALYPHEHSSLMAICILIPGESMMLSSLEVHVAGFDESDICLRRFLSSCVSALFLKSAVAALAMFAFLAFFESRSVDGMFSVFIRSLELATP